jgi:hypothetical protein
MTNILDVLQSTYPQVSIPQKGGVKRDVDWSGMTVETLAHLVYHGLKQKTSDSYSVFKGTESEKRAQAQKVVDNLEKNDLRAERESDPVMVELKRLASARVSKERPANVKAVDWLKSNEAKAIWDKVLANPEYRKIAEANAAAAQNSIEIEL